MKGLLYKDLTILRRQGKFYLLIILVFSLVPQFSRAGMAVAYAAILPYSVIAYDEQSKWSRLAIMLPYTDKQLILSKYILSWAAMLIVMLLSLISLGASRLYSAPPAQLITEVQEVFLQVLLSSLFAAAVLPLIFRFGVERGRLAFIPVVVFGVIGVVFAGERFAPLLPDVSAWWAVLIALLVAVLANAISVTLSRRFFRRGLRV